MAKKPLNATQARRYRWLKTAQAALGGEARELSDMHNKRIDRERTLSQERSQLERNPNSPGAAERLKFIAGELNAIADDGAEISRLQGALSRRVQRLSALRTKIDQWLIANGFQIPGEPGEAPVSEIAHREFRMHDRQRAEANQGR